MRQAPESTDPDLRNTEEPNERSDDDGGVGDDVGSCVDDLWDAFFSGNSTAHLENETEGRLDANARDLSGSDGAHRSCGMNETDASKPPARPGTSLRAASSNGDADATSANVVAPAMSFPHSNCESRIACYRNVAYCPNPSHHR